VLGRISHCSSVGVKCTYGVNIGVWVLGLAVLGQDTWGNLVDLRDELEHRIVWHLSQTKFSLRHVSRIGLSEHSVAVTWNDTATVQGLPEVVLDLLVAQITTNTLLHAVKPVEHFLVSPKNLLIRYFKLDNFTYNPWSGPARPFRPAARDSIGELRAEPTKWVV